MERLERRDLLATLGDLVWLDADQDGIRQPAEVGVPGVVVELLTAQGASHGIQITGEDGRYAFSDVAPGDYQLDIRLPVGFSFTARDSGDDDHLDSDIDPATGLSDVFAVAGDDLTRDVGLRGAAPEFGFALAAGGLGSDLSRSLAMDDAGNVYVTGSFVGQVDFDAGPGVRPLTSQGQRDMFLAKYGPGGALFWARSFGGADATAEGLGVAVGPAGDVYVAGNFSGSVDFDPSPGVVQERTSADWAGFVARLDSSGDLVWARHAVSGGGTSRGNALAVDGDGNVHVTGQFTGAVDFRPGDGVHILDAGSASHAFFWKLSGSGALDWVRSASGDHSENAGQRVVADGSGGIFAAGRFGNTLGFDGIELQSHGGTDLFLTRLNASGQFLWAGGLGGDGQETLGGLAVDVRGNVTLAGGFEQTLDVDPGAGEYLLTAMAGEDAFVSRLDADGQLRWARGFGGSGSERATGVAVDGNGNVYATGRFDGTADFDPGVGSELLSSAGDFDVFVSKLDGLGNHAGAVSVGGPGADEASGLVVDGAGRVRVTGAFATEPGLGADFDPGSESFLLESAGSDDVFLASYSLEQPGNSAPAIDPAGAVIVTDEETPVTVALSDWLNNGAGTTTIADADATDSLGGVAITKTTGQGVFSYSLDGSTWLPVGAVSAQQALLLPPQARLRYTPDGIDGETAEAVYRAWDGTEGVAGQKVDAGAAGGNSAFSVQTDSVTIDVASVNDAPTLQPATPTVVTDEDTPREFAVADLSNGAVGATVIDDVDPDDPRGGIGLTQFTGMGRLEYSLDGQEFFDVGQLLDVAALLLPAAARLRYLPNEVEGQDALLSYVAWDRSSGLPGDRANTSNPTATGPFSSQGDTLRIQVTDVNDAPELLPGNPVRATDEDHPLVISLGGFINHSLDETRISDVDFADPLGGIAVVATSGHGAWEYSIQGGSYEQVGAVSESSALLLPAVTVLRYTPDSDNGETAFLRFRAWDESQGSAGGRLSVGVPGGTSPFSVQRDTLWINVSDLNDAPSDLILENTSIPENKLGGGVGAVTVIDPDIGDTHVFTVSDSRFQVLDGLLKLKPGQVLDHESSPVVSIAITATDPGQLDYTETFVIDVVDINEPPILIQLSHRRVAENELGAVVGDLTVLDPDDGDTHQLGISDARFEILGARLKLKDDVSLDHETDDPVTIQVTAFDSESLTRNETFVIRVEDRNEPPVAVTIGGNTIEEERPGAVVGPLQVIDPDGDQQHTFGLSDDRFEVAGGYLKLKRGVRVDFESEPQISFQLTATDSGRPALHITVPIVLTVLNVNEPASGLTLRPAAVDENEPGGVIGNLIVEDPESGDGHTFQVSDNRFEVVDGTLRLKPNVALDHETAPTVDIKVTVADDGRPPRQATHEVTVQVTDVNEAPETVGSLPDRAGMSNVPLQFEVAVGTFIDVDQGDQLRYSAASADGGGLPDWLSFDGSTRTFSGVPSIYDPGPYSIQVTATDRGNLSADDTFTLVVHAAPAPWQNPANPMDVNNDGMVSPVDILILINFINTRPGNPALPTAPFTPPPFYDVNGDNLITPADILAIINYANGGGTAEGEGPPLLIAPASDPRPSAGGLSSAVVTGPLLPRREFSGQVPPSLPLAPLPVDRVGLLGEPLPSTERREVWELLSSDGDAAWWDDGVCEPRLADDSPR